MKNNVITKEKILYQGMDEFNRVELFHFLKHEKEDKEIVSFIGHKFPQLIIMLSEETSYLCEDIDLAKRIIESNLHNDSNLSELFSKELLSSKELMSIVLKENKYLFNSIDDSLKEDEGFIFNLLNCNVDITDYLSPSMLVNEKVILKAVDFSPKIISKLPKKLLNNEEFAQKVLDANTECYRYFGEDIKNNEKLFKKYILDNCHILEHTSDTIKSNKNIIMELISQKGYCFYYLDKSLRQDKDIFFLALKTEPEIVEYIEDNLSNDYDVIRQIITTGANIPLLIKIGENLINDSEKMKELLKLFNDKGRLELDHLLRYAIDPTLFENLIQKFYQVFQADGFKDLYKKCYGNTSKEKFEENCIDNPEILKNMIFYILEDEMLKTMVDNKSQENTSKKIKF